MEQNNNCPVEITNFLAKSREHFDVYSSLLKQAVKKYYYDYLNSDHFKAKLREKFDNADRSKDGKLDIDEIYTLVLYFYMLIAQNTNVIAKYIPTRDDIREIVADIVKDGGESVSFEDFEALSKVLFEGVASQLFLQLIFTVFIAPFLAIATMFFIKWICLLVPFVMAQFWFVPWFLRNNTIGAMILVPLFNAVLLPYYLEYFYEIRAIINPEKTRLDINKKGHQNLFRKSELTDTNLPKQE